MRNDIHSIDNSCSVGHATVYVRIFQLSEWAQDTRCLDNRAWTIILWNKHIIPGPVITCSG